MLVIVRFNELMDTNSLLDPFIINGPRDLTPEVRRIPIKQTVYVTLDAALDPGTS